MSNTLEFANEFTCPKCCERLRVDRAVPPEPVPVPDTPRIRDFTFWDLTRPAEVRLDMPVVWQGGWRDYDNAKQAIKAKSFGFAYQAYVSNEDALAFPWDNIPSIMAASDGPWTREQMLALYAQVPAEVMCAFPEHLADIQSQEFIQAWRRCNPFDPRAETWAYRSPYALFGEVIRAKFYGRIVKAGPQLFNSYTGAPENPAMVDFAIRGAFREGADGIVCWGESRCTKDTIPWDIINAAFDEPRIVRQPVWGVYEPFLAIDDAAMWELLIRFFDFELFDDLADVGNYKHVLIPVLHENYWVDWETRWYRDKTAKQIADVEALIPNLSGWRLEEQIARLAELQARIPFMEDHDWPVSCSLETLPDCDIWTQCSEPTPYGGHFSIPPVSRIPRSANVIPSGSDTQWKPSFSTRSRDRIRAMAEGMPDRHEDAGVGD